nr:1,2-phenylacetyl-CoA epoxidase subunit PaaD [Verminephrobacter eiseniae]
MMDAPARLQRAWEVLDSVPDPELPAVSLCDLGIVRDVRLAGAALQLLLTPTYSGCPATEVIAHDVLAAIDAAGLGPAQVQWQRAPAWSTDWITERGRARLHAHGIAPPGAVAAGNAVSLHFMPRAAAAPVSMPRAAAALVSRHRSDVVGCAQPSERSARRIAQPIPSVLASDATPRCASMASADRQMIGDATLACPRCGSRQTQCLSAFGATACKALYRCLDCREPFEHFKPL